ncbi:MAG: hypothetical protein JNL57_10705 [Bacteroidetes bacterium]|nr:hypothetical protein [Bacteroidota bacterium]
MKLLFLPLMLGFTLLSAQKVDLDPYNFGFSYRDLPHSVTDSTLKTYAVKVDISGRMEEYMTADVISSKLAIQGREKVYRSPKIRWEFQVEDLVLEKFEIKEKVTSTTNKDKTVTKTTTYWVQLTYNISGKSRLLDANGLALSRELDLFNGRSFVWDSKEFSYRSDASSFYYANRASLMSKMVREKMDYAIGYANRWANEQAGFPEMSTRMYLWLVDNKNHPEYEPMSQRWNALKPALEGIYPDELRAEDSSKIAQMILYFDGLKTKYSKDEKADRKIRYAAWYNNAVLYMILDQPEKAIEQTVGLISNDFDTKDGETLQKQANQLQDLFRRNSVYTRHFPLNEIPYR